MNKSKISFKRLIKYGFLFILMILIWSKLAVYFTSKDYLFSKVEDVPSRKVGLLLGTSRYLKSGSENAYFFNRIETTVALYNSGKIKCVLVSGDNGTKEYNEPEDMKTELIKRGIPENKIYLDFAGFDTYDSMIRAQKVFGLNGFTVISQRFHNKRAVYIARKNGIDAIACNAKDVDAYFGLKTNIREFFACVKAFFEVKLAADPTFLGERIKILE
ncbi:MAG: YdcF family protein [Fluviicola sp.]|jgi:SanA protein|nr:YdcF family protein [Fluviicola sp.]